MSKNFTFFGGMCGLLASPLFILLYSIAWSLSPWYVLGENYPSDLGVGGGALAFNSGTIISGVLALPFAMTLWRMLGRSRLSSLGCLLLAASGVALISIGVFTEDYGVIHFAVSALFFLLVLLSQILLAWPLVNSPKFKIVGISVTVLMVGTLSSLPLVGPGPLAETIAVIEILIWSFAVASQTTRIILKERKVLSQRGPP